MPFSHEQQSGFCKISLFFAILPPYLGSFACKLSLPQWPARLFHLQQTISAPSPDAHTLPGLVFSAAPSLSAGKVHQESPLSAVVFCIHFPVELWLTGANRSHVLIFLFALPAHVLLILHHSVWIAKDFCLLQLWIT